MPTSLILQEPIISLCTPKGEGALALLRLSGQGVCALVDKIAHLSGGATLANVSTHTIHHGYVHALGKKESVIDEVLFFVMHGPRTFTGEDTVEISCHNNAFIIEEIIAQSIAAGARHAEPGEFTKRAFLNGKIDLIQAESINELIHATSPFALRQSMAQLRGTLSHHLAQIEQDLLAVLTLTEASFEFLDEEQRDLDFDLLIRQGLASVSQKVAQLVKDFSFQRQIREGVRIAIIGEVNAGKSTLFNVLLNKDRAIVTEKAGTTRDTIEGMVFREGLFWTYVDTAGLRQTNETIEKQGIARSWDEAALADVILLVFDSSKQPLPAEQAMYHKIIESHAPKTIVVANKSDKEQRSDFSGDFTQQIDALRDNKKIFKANVSTREPFGIEELQLLIASKVKEVFGELKSPFLLSIRQQGLLGELDQKLKTIALKCTNSIEYELVAHHLREVLERMSELTGKSIEEKVLDSVFRDFCIGK